MTSKALSERRDQESSGSPLLVRAEHLLDELKEVSKTIADRAYEFFERRGHEPGKDMEDWLRAESELLRPLPLDVAETANQITVRAEVPGFTAEQIRVSVEPRGLIINAKVEKRLENSTYSERHTKDVFRALELDTDIDPDKVTAKLKDGVLTLTLPKTEPVREAATASGGREGSEIPIK